MPPPTQNVALNQNILNNLQKIYNGRKVFQEIAQELQKQRYAQHNQQPVSIQQYLNLWGKRETERFQEFTVCLFPLKLTEV